MIGRWDKFGTCATWAEVDVDLENPFSEATGRFEKKHSPFSGGRPHRSITAFRCYICGALGLWEPPCSTAHAASKPAGHSGTCNAKVETTTKIMIPHSLCNSGIGYII